MTALLHIAGLQVRFDGRPVLRGVSLAVRAGESVVLLGESGSGKTTLALAVTRLLAEPGGRIASGEILFQDRDLLRLEERQMQAIRGRAIGMVFQEPQSALNPVMTIGQQLRECPQMHERGRAAQLLKAVGLDATARILKAYPHQLSGGMRQRAMIAMALAGEPALLIADEPTSALDVTVQAQILDLLRAEQRRRRMALLLVTHDLGVARHMAERVAVLYDGQIVEEADAAVFFGGPCHPYSQALFAALPQSFVWDATPPLEQRPVAAKAGCAYAPRCPRRVSLCLEVDPPLTEYAGARVRCHRPGVVPSSAARLARTGAPRPPTSQPLLAVRGLCVRFKGRRGVGGGRDHEVVRAVSFDMETGQTLALVGESGSGKTTIARALLRLTPAYAGDISFAGLHWSELAGEGLRRERPALQMIFQDPYGALNPRLQAGAIVSEGLRAQGQLPDASALCALLRQVGLSEEMLLRYPHQFSGGQRQRLAIARALAVRPKLLICDEPTSALDVSVQAQILGLLVSLQQQSGLSYLFITHNMAIVASLAHDVLVLFAGQIVERGPVASVLQHPRHPYTQALLAAVLPVTSEQGPAPQGGTPAGGAGEGPGCSFRFRCPAAQPLCVARAPEESVVGDGHRVRCHYPLDP